MKDHRQRRIDKLNEEALYNARLEYEEQCRRLPDMQDAKILAKLSDDLLLCIKSITDSHMIEDCLLPDKTSLIHFLECKWDFPFARYEIKNGKEHQTWPRFSFVPSPLNAKCSDISTHIYEWITLLGTIAKSINSPNLSEFTYCRGIFGSAYCEIGGLEHLVAVNVTERIFRANASLAAEVAFTKDVRYPYRVFFDVEVAEDQEDVENCQDEDEAFERDRRNVTKIYNELYGNSIHDVIELESGFARLLSEVKGNELSPRSTLWLRLQDPEKICHVLLMRTKIYSLHFSDKDDGTFWHVMPEHEHRMKLIDTIAEYCKLSGEIAKRNKEPALQLTFAELSLILTEQKHNLESCDSYSLSLAKPYVEYLASTLVKAIPRPTPKTVILAGIGDAASKELGKTIKEAKKPKKRGKLYGKRDPKLHKDRIAVLTEIDRRRTNIGTSLSQVIQIMKNDSAYAARMKDVSVGGWRSYYYDWKRTHKSDTDCNL